MKDIFLEFPMWFRIFIVMGGLIVSGAIIVFAMYKISKSKTIGLDITVGPIKADIDLDAIEEKKEVQQ